MATTLRIAFWNSNGLSNHIQELILFLNTNKIDILLISETHSTGRTVIKIPHYDIYYANHPDGSAHAGSAVIIRKAINHYSMQPYVTVKIQSAIIKLQAFPWPLTIAAIYSPPRHIISTDEYLEFLATLGPHFLVAGDWNAKHTAWGSRLITPKGRNLLEAIQQNNLNYLSAGEPTYWPTDLNKIPDLLDFAVTKGISNLYSRIEPNLDLSSDHSAVIITLSTNVIWREPPPSLCSKLTNWDLFEHIINENINSNFRIKESRDIEEAVQYFTKLLQDAAWQATPERRKILPDYHNIPLHIKRLIQEKRKARGKWQRTRNPQNKTILNRLTHRLSVAMQEARNASFEHYITSLTLNDHSIWKAAKKFKRPVIAVSPIRNPVGSWARSNEDKANVFAEHLTQVFTPTSSVIDETEIQTYLDAACQLSPPVKAFASSEVLSEIKLSNSHKAPGYDLIVGEILKHLPKKAIVLLTTIYNSILRLCHYPIQWKFAQIIMVAKSGKPPTDPTSYRPISLLPLLSNIFERLLLNRIKEIVPIGNLIPEHQFGFREKHSTVQQCHRLVNEIKVSLEEKKMCAAVFLDIQQAFDKVWHEGLLYKLKTHLPDQLYLLLKSYMQDRHFQVKIDDTVSAIYPIKSGVPQGSVLGPYFYLIFTADLPVTEDTTTATFADDTAILAADSNPERASEKLQNHLYLLQDWFKQWKIQVNTEKSTQITFTTKRSSCPQVTINDAPIPVKTEVKYLGLHLDEKLTWKAHIKAKKQQLNLKTRQMYWLIGRKSQLSLDNKVIIYKAVLRPIWSYGIELWGCSKPSNTKILQTVQSKILRIITGAPWYISNHTLHNDLNIPYITDVVRIHATKYRNRNVGHSNNLVNELLSQSLDVRRLKRQWPEDLTR